MKKVKLKCFKNREAVSSKNNLTKVILKTTIYTSDNKYSLKKIAVEIWEGFLEGQGLAYQLFKRDLKASYQKSLLGVLWLFIPPFFTAGIWIFLNDQGIVAIQDTPMRYAAFALCGSILWSLFAEAMNKPMVRFQTAMSMLSKLNFPREALILNAFYEQLFSLFLKLLVLIPVLMFLGYYPNWTWVWGLLGILGLILVGFTFGLLICPLGLLYMDIGKALPLVLPFAMYLSPVIYPLRSDGVLLKLQNYNPVTPFLELARSSFGEYDFVMWDAVGIWTIVLLFGFGLSLVIMKISMPVIVERSGF
ncbi:ABC transporter permease [Cognataquiflexum rubidum]|uniref:ABC transporter permease n=1 Tax=Cognataquiflexum rubidum TaxID=2922273 RepID=UPI001F148280|nr:ABC transporter permease [Cognataquiflexum rubidum]MCH6236508.1 ABC transporter permease [Cognataquiflexum rubidum]